MHVEADSQGKWTVPKIPNPEYKGIWAPRKIANPQFFEDSSPADFTKIGGIGIELWTMTEDILCTSHHSTTWQSQS
jgi:calnexin